MVQLTPSQTLDLSPPTGLCEEGRGVQGSPKAGDSPRVLTTLQLTLNPSSTTYPGYETYIEDGLICLKHKIRNIEKKKLKLEEYRKRLQNGGRLNQDQLDAVEKYDEVVHNLAFAREMHKTLGKLTQDLLRAQRKAVRKEQAVKVEHERKRFCTVLQVQYVLQNLQHEHVRKDFSCALNRAHFLSTQELDSLFGLAALLGCKRDNKLSLDDQMERATTVYLELLEGKDKPVLGSTYKRMKEQLLKLVDCGYFDRVLAPKIVSKEDVVVKQAQEGVLRPGGLAGGLAALVKLNSKEVPTREFLNRRFLPDTNLSGRGQDEKTLPPNWKAEFLALKEQEPPDSWDMEFSERPPAPQTAGRKPWRGAVGLIPKVPSTVQKPSAEPKQKRQRKTKVGHNTKPVSRSEAPVEVYKSPSALPEDPVLRKQELDDLLDQIRGSFSFMQDSLLDGDVSPTNPRSRMCSPSLSPDTPLALKEADESPVDLLPKTLHSTPLPVRLLSMEAKPSLTNGEQSLDSCDLDLTAEEAVHEKLQLSGSEGFTSPPLYRRESSISLSLEENPPALHSRPQTPVCVSGKQSPCNGVMPPVSAPAEAFSTPPSRRTLSMASTAPFQSMHSVFKVNAPLPPSSNTDLMSEAGGFSDPACLSYGAASALCYATVSTQTPPELNPPDEEPEVLYQTGCVVSNGGQVFLSPVQTPAPVVRQGTPFYPRGSARGMARAGRLAHSFRSPAGHRGGFEGYRTGLRSPGGFIPPIHTMRDPGSVLYAARDSGYQHSYKRGAGAHRNNSSAGWSDSSQVSSPDREGVAAYLLDSGHGDSLSPVDLPVTPQGPPTLLPVHVYPLNQPLRVAFSSARTANFAPGTLDQPIAFDLLHSNLGEMFDCPSGRFSCPAAGTYVFLFHILKLAVNVPLYVNLMRNDEVMVSAYANDGAPDHETASNHAVLQLYHGDQVWLRLHRGAIYGSSWKYSTFSGFLLYQD